MDEVWRREERHPFTGWDFSHLDGRMREDQPPWSYTSRASELMDSSGSVLDMGTGGGERLLVLRERWPTRVVATEDHPPNVELARSRLEPLGCSVVDVPSNRTPMPFADGEFDLILCRYVGLYYGEGFKRGLYRRLRGVLKPGGWLALGASEAMADPVGFEAVPVGDGHAYRAVAPDA